MGKAGLLHAPIHLKAYLIKFTHLLLWFGYRDELSKADCQSLSNAFYLPFQ
jgi:hypothetical protein